jgi:hypothetical protein
MINSKPHNNTLMAATISALIFAMYGCTETQSHRSDKPIMELNTDRPGSDISTVALEKPKPALCHRACQSNSECVAWTYVKPGIINNKAHCRLKSKLPDPERSSCCISGRK